MIQEIRQKFNEKIEEYGNNKVMFSEKYGFGDLLTEKVNFRRVGAVIGGLVGGIIGVPGIILTTPFAIIDSAYGDTPLDVICNSLMPIPVMAGFFGGVGYMLGEQLDALFGDLTPEMERYRKYRKETKKLRDYHKYYLDITNFMTEEEIEEGIKKYGTMEKLRKVENRESRKEMNRGGSPIPF